MSHRPFRVVFIDDYSPFCDSLADVIEQEFGDKVTPIQFCDPKKAEEIIAWIIEEKPDIVFLDFLLDREDPSPKKSMQIYKALKRAMVPTAIFFITAVIPSDIRFELLEKEARVLEKPIMVESILSIIQACLDIKESK